MLDKIKQLREITGISMAECKKAVDEAKGDIDKALEFLHRQGKIKAQKKAERQTKTGIIEAYVHPNKKVGVMLELNCETDFVGKNEEFSQLAHEICLQIAAMSPQYIKPEEVPQDFLKQEREIYREQLKGSGKPENLIDGIVEGKVKKYCEEISLLTQVFIKDNQKTVQDIINDYIMKIGENISIKRFSRFQI